MIRTEYLTIDDFKIVEIAQHCDWDKLNIAIDDALKFDLPGITEEYYGLILDAFNKEVNKVSSEFSDNFSTDFDTDDLINGTNYKCGNRTINFLGLKDMLVYYSYANYLMNSTMNDSGIGFVKKTDQFSVPTPLKDIKEFVNSYRNRGYAIFKQLKKYVCHIPELANEYNLSLNCDCGCKNDNHFTEKRIYTFRPKIIKR